MQSLFDVALEFAYRDYLPLGSLDFGGFGGLGLPT